MTTAIDSAVPEDTYVPAQAVLVCRMCGTHSCWLAVDRGLSFSRDWMLIEQTFHGDEIPEGWTSLEGVYRELYCPACSISLEAYTIGKRDCYDPLFDDGKQHWKLGQFDRNTGARRMYDAEENGLDPNGTKPYIGGWVFRTFEEANTLVRTGASRSGIEWLETWGDRADYRVYKTTLLGLWSSMVTPHRDSITRCYHLIQDAKLDGPASL